MISRRIINFFTIKLKNLNLISILIVISLISLSFAPSHNSDLDIHKSYNEDQFIDSRINEIDLVKSKVSQSENSYSEHFKLTQTKYFGSSFDDEVIDVKIDTLGNTYLVGIARNQDLPLVNGFDTTFSGNEDGFLAIFDKQLELVYSTFIGGSGTDTPTNIEIDVVGNVLIAGTTDSTDFPTINAYQGTIGGGVTDVFLIKISNTSVPLFSTYLGGSSSELQKKILLDTNNNIFLSGETDSSDFPVLNPLNGSYSGGIDGYLSKLDETGNLIYSTYIGGDNLDNIIEMQIDSNSNLYLGGDTFSSNFPIFNTNYPNLFGDKDPFLMKFDSNENLIYSSYFGGSQEDELAGLVIDGSDNIFISGNTYSDDIPISSDAFDPLYSEYEDSFITKFDSDGSLIFSTYYGGTSDSKITKMKGDKDGNVYITGVTYGGIFSIPHRNDITIFSDTGGGDPFFAKFSENGGLLISSIIGGVNYDQINDFHLNNNSEIILVGHTFSYNFPTLNQFDPLTKDGHHDADQDFVSNYDEYKAGTDPRDPNSYPLLSINSSYVFVAILITLIVMLIGSIGGFYYLRKFKISINTASYIETMRFWMSDFKKYNIYKQGKLKGATNQAQFKLIKKYKAPNYEIAQEIDKGKFKDYEQYLNGKVVGAQTLKELELVEKLGVEDYETALKQIYKDKSTEN